MPPDSCHLGRPPRPSRPAAHRGIHRTSHPLQHRVLVRRHLRDHLQHVHPAARRSSPGRRTGRSRWLTAEGVSSIDAGRRAGVHAGGLVNDRRPGPLSSPRDPSRERRNVPALRPFPARAPRPGAVSRHRPCVLARRVQPRSRQLPSVPCKSPLRGNAPSVKGLGGISGFFGSGPFGFAARRSHRLRGRRSGASRIPDVLPLRRQSCLPVAQRLPGRSAGLA